MPGRARPDAANARAANASRERPARGSTGHATGKTFLCALVYGACMTRAAPFPPARREAAP